MSSRYTLHEPGDVVPVEVTDDAEPGDLVTVSGEGESFTQVATATGSDVAIGMLQSSDGTTDSAVKMFKPVVWLRDSGTNAAGATVAEAADGQVQASTDKTDMFGIVFSTRSRSLHIGDRKAVAVTR